MKRARHQRYIVQKGGVDPSFLCITVKRRPDKGDLTVSGQYVNAARTREAGRRHHGPGRSRNRSYDAPFDYSTCGRWLLGRPRQTVRRHEAPVPLGELHLDHITCLLEHLDGYPIGSIRAVVPGRLSPLWQCSGMHIQGIERSPAYLHPLFAQLRLILLGLCACTEVSHLEVGSGVLRR